MTTRTAEEANISSDNDNREPTRKKLSQALTKTVPNTATLETDPEVLNYIPPPPPLDPIHIHGWDPTTITDNQNPDQVALWNQETGAKVLVYKAHGGRIATREEISKVRSLIKTALEIDHLPTVATPSPTIERGRRDSAPICSLVKGILPEKAQLLIEKRFISSPEITIFFIPYSPPPYHFVTTLKGFIFLDEKDKRSEEEVAKVVGETLFSPTAKTPTTTAIKRIVAFHQDNLPITLESLDTILSYLRNSVAVRRLNLVKRELIGTGDGETHPAWNIYIAPPTTNQSILKLWRDIIRKTTFVTNDDGAGRTYKIFRCSTCLSCDHPGGLCIYPSLPEWHAPAATTSPALDDLLNANTAQGSNRNANGRGRGRGTPLGNRGRGNARRNAPRA